MRIYVYLCMKYHLAPCALTNEICHTFDLERNVIYLNSLNVEIFQFRG